MNNEEMMAIAEKIKNGTATQEELVEFSKSFSDLMSSLKNDLVA